MGSTVVRPRGTFRGRWCYGVPELAPRWRSREWMAVARERP